jgi:hypothetical protein
MPRANPRAVAAPPGSSAPTPAPATTTWAEWPWRLQAFQVHAVRDVLGVFNHHVGALLAARDAQAFGAAQQAFVGDWLGCVEGVQRRWVTLACAVPPEALNASGWRLTPAARGLVATQPGAGAPDLFGQARLGLEVLLRPWLPATDLDHTEEFTA